MKKLLTIICFTLLLSSCNQINYNRTENFQKAYTITSLKMDDDNEFHLIAFAENDSDVIILKDEKQDIELFKNSKLFNTPIIIRNGINYYQNDKLVNKLYYKKMTLVLPENYTIDIFND